MTEEQEQKPAVEKNPHIYKPAYTSHLDLIRLRLKEQGLE